jgi:hypothetical protein
MRSSFLGQQHASIFENVGLQTARQVATTSAATRSPSPLIVLAGPAGRARRNSGSGKGPTQKPPPGMPKRPDSGFFADTDPNGKKETLLNLTGFCSALAASSESFFPSFSLQLQSILSAAVFKAISPNVVVDGKVILSGIKTGKMLWTMRNQ